MKALPVLGRYLANQACWVFATVFVLRLVVLTRLTNSAFLLPSRGDMHFYNEWAQRILQGDVTDHLAFYGLPLYAYLLAILYKGVGYSPFVVGFLQALLEGGTAVLIYQLAIRAFPAVTRPGAPRVSGRVWSFIVANERQFAGLLAALAWAFFVPAQAYSVILMPTVWLIFAFWFVVWRIVRAESAPTAKDCVLLGLLIGVTAMAVATILFLIPLVLAALLLKPRPNNHARRRAIGFGVALLLFGIAAGTSPCWIHNYFVARDPVFLSAHSGINFWIGNNPDAHGYPRFPPGLRAGQAAMLQDSITNAESAAGHSLKRSEVSAYWSAKAKDYISGHFGQWLKLLLIKLRNVWSAFQYDDLSIITNLREQRVVLPGLYFGVVAAFALPGMFFAWRLAPKSRWIAAAIFLHIAALLTVFVTERYRLPIVPGLLLFAVFGLSIFWRDCVFGEQSRLLVYLALLAASAIFVSWPQRNPSLWALDAYNSGWQALESNNLPLAERKLSLALAYVPDNAETNFALGNLRLAQGDSERAKAFYRSVLQIDPQHKGAFNNLGVIALQTEHFSEAHFWFEHAIVLAPRDAKAHYLLAKTFRAEGNWPAAKGEIERAIELDSAQPEFIQLRDEIRRAKPD